jgi:hypothetical protein
MTKLDNIIHRLINEGIKVESIQEEIRGVINPIQCAYCTIFAEKNKYRKELIFDDVDSC